MWSPAGGELFYRDGRRFLMIKTGDIDDQGRPRRINVVANWYTESR